MNIQEIRKVLGWSFLINSGLMIFTMIIYFIGRDFIYQIHSTFFTMSVETYEAIWYAAFFFWKIMIFVLAVVPYIALRLVENKQAILQ